MFTLPLQVLGVAALVAAGNSGVTDRGAPRLWIKASASASPGELWRAADGLFYVNAEVNGAAVRFLVDTGASTIVLTPADAARAGVLAAARFDHQGETAGGAAAFARVTLEHVRVATTDGRRVPAAVAREGLGVSLLGQSWLSSLGSVTIEGDRMLLR
jgi:aspartyl protease family protein